MKRKEWMQRKPLQRRSRKQQALYDQRVPIIRDAMLEGRICEAGVRIADVDMAGANRCQLRAVDWHERLARSAGGSIIDPSNRVWVCRPCHEWIGSHPTEARMIGLAESRYGTA